MKSFGKRCKTDEGDNCRIRESNSSLAALLAPPSPDLTAKKNGWIYIYIFWQKHLTREGGGTQPRKGPGRGYGDGNYLFVTKKGEGRGVTVEG